MEGITAGLLIDQFINGLVTGGFYIALALGLSIIFGMIGIVNFAHGALYTVGAYAAMEVSRRFGIFPSIVISPILVGIIGMAIEVVLLRRFYRGIPELGLLFTFGLSMFIEQAIRVVWGPAPYALYAPPEVSGALQIGDFYYSRYRAFVFFCIVAAVVALWWFLEKTRYGRIIRAGSRDGQMVQMLGINLKPVFTMVFGIGVALAAFAGLLQGPLSEVSPAMGNAVGTAAFVVVVIGGLGSFWGVIASGILVGQVISFMKVFWPPMSEASIYMLMVLVLLIRPRGLFGERWERFE